MNRAKAFLVLSTLTITAILLCGAGSSAQPAAGMPATKPAGSAAARPATSKPTTTPATAPSTSSRPAHPGSAPAYPLWDGNESVADYAKRAGIKDAQIELKLDGNVTIKLTLIPAGKFLMGSPDSDKDRTDDEVPQHEVTITKPFYMGVYTVTQEQYEQVTRKSPSSLKGAHNPVEKVSWDDAVEFCRRLSQKTGRAVSLPTEAQWEHACRAGSKTRFSFGDDDDKLGDYAWYEKNSERKTHPVGLKKTNEWGLHDMHGNVWQWCADWHEFYANAKNQDPQGPDSGSYRVLRGGGLRDDPQYCRCAIRGRDMPGDRNFNIGFRVSVDLPVPRPVESLAATPSGTQETWIATVDGGDKVSWAYILGVNQDKVVSGDVIIMDSQGFKTFTESDGKKELPPEQAKRVPMRKFRQTGSTIFGEIDLQNAQSPTGTSHFKLTIILGKELRGLDPVPATVKSNDDSESVELVFKKRSL